MATLQAPQIRKAVATTLTLLAVAVLVVVIGGDLFFDRTSGKVRPLTPLPSLAEVRAKFWAEHHVTNTPPGDIFDVHRSLTPGYWNRTLGLVSDGDAYRWFIGALRSNSAKLWALEHFRHDVVDADVIGRPGLDGANIAISNLQTTGAASMTITDAKGVGMQLHHLTADQSAALVPDRTASYAILLRSRGPSTGILNFPGGVTQTLWDLGSGGSTRHLLVGEYREDPISSGLWYEFLDVDCNRTSGAVEIQLCNLVQPY
jgi:hypothetical protein